MNGNFIGRLDSKTCVAETAASKAAVLAQRYVSPSTATVSATLTQRSVSTGTAAFKAAVVALRSVSPGTGNFSGTIPKGRFDLKICVDMSGRF